MFGDQSVAMALKWKGKVSLKVTDRLSHGFHTFAPLSKSCFDGLTVCVQEIKKLF